MPMRPEYNETDAKWGEVGEQVACAWMRRRGFSVTRLPNGIYGPDILCKSEMEQFHLETERRRGWTPPDDVFPYRIRPPNVPVGRKLSDDRLFLTMRSDMKIGIVIFGCDLLVAPIVTVNNRRMQGEQMRQIVYERCLPVDLTVLDNRPFAEVNRDRIKAAMERLDDRTLRKRYLNSVCPYGMDMAEWCEFLKASDTVLELPKKSPQMQLFS